MITGSAVRIDVYIEAPPERVWPAFASADGWRAWFNAKTEIEPRLGGRFRIEGTHRTFEYVFTGEVITFDPPRKIEVTWIPQGTDWPFRDRHSRVLFELRPDGPGTRVFVTHHGFDELPEPYRTKEHSDFARGWRADEELAWLKDYVERGIKHFA
jgi:uncharacterized protein YndB with AHSA1/START domain